MPIMASRRMNIPPAASKVHFRDDDERLLPDSDLIFGNSLNMPKMHHPRISVVIMVDTTCAMYGLLMIGFRIEAPTVPKRYPRMLAMMTIAAVNSILRLFRKHIRRTIVMVSKVSRSSSSMPAILQLSATTACISANEWMIQLVFILEKTDIRFCF